MCFPRFGAGPVEGAALHGFVRTSMWSLVEVLEDGDDVRVVVARLLCIPHDDEEHPVQARHDT